jgi:hypothetical protein
MKPTERKDRTMREALKKHIKSKLVLFLFCTAGEWQPMATGACALGAGVTAHGVITATEDGTCKVNTGVARVANVGIKGACGVSGIQCPTADDRVAELTGGGSSAPAH